MCGKPPEYKFWQDYYKVGDLDGVYESWKQLAEDEKKTNQDRQFWTVIIEMIKYKQKKND